MATTTALPYGLRDVKVATLDAAGVVGTMTDLPNAQTFSFSESEEFTELRGDDVVVAIHGMGATVEWELESGGIDFSALVILNGGAKTSTGSGLTLVETYSKLDTDSRPYFVVEGQAISDNGGDFHCRLYRCKATESFEGQFADGEFWVSKASGKAYGSITTGSTGKIYTFTANKTTAAIV